MTEKKRRGMFIPADERDFSPMTVSGNDLDNVIDLAAKNLWSKHLKRSGEITTLPALTASPEDWKKGVEEVVKYENPFNKDKNGNVRDRHGKIYQRKTKPSAV